VDVVAGRASIVGAAATHVGKVRDHNEDAYFYDADAGLFLVCDGMGGHAAGEVASDLAIRTIRSSWSADPTQKLIDSWIDTGEPELRRQLLAMLRDGVLSAHAAILADAELDESRSGMGTTLVGGIVVGNELVFAHAGDSRAYLVRDGIAMQLTEDHTLLSRLLAAGIDVDLTGEGARFRSMLTNALGIGKECKVSTFVIPLADGDRFLLCSDGITEYVKEAEVGEVLIRQPSPARAAQKLIELALERGGGDNATAIVIRVLEAGETPQPAELKRREEATIASCPLWGKLTPQQRLRALRITLPREHVAGDRIAASTLGDRVAWIVVEGLLAQDGATLEPGALVYPESLVQGSQPPDRDRLAVARTDVRLLALRADDFRELCDDDPELGETLLATLGGLVSRPKPRADTHADTVIEGRPDQVFDADAELDLGSVIDPPTHVLADPGSLVELAPSNAVVHVEDELEARFDAVTDAIPAPASTSGPPAGRVPLILRPEPRAISIASISIPPPRAMPRPVVQRPPSEPEIEIEIELDDGDDDEAVPPVLEDEPTSVRGIAEQSSPLDRRSKRLSDGWED
jgi:PPM family protein phosphatase